MLISRCIAGSCSAAILLLMMVLMVSACAPIQELNEPLVLPEMHVDTDNDFPAPKDLRADNTKDGRYVFKLSRLDADETDIRKNDPATSLPWAAARDTGRENTGREDTVTSTPTMTAKNPIDAWLPLVVDPTIRTSAGNVRRDTNVFVHDNGMTTSLVGNVYLNSDGSFTQHDGDTFIHSDGTSTVRRGNTFLHSDGTISRVIDNQIERSSGVHCTLEANVAFCH